MTVPSADFLSIRIGTRFLMVTFFPNVAFTALIAGLVVAGAPGHRPSWPQLDHALRSISLGGVILLVLSVTAFSLALHPLNYSVIQLMEGYWSGIPFGPHLERIAAARGERHRRFLRDSEGDGNDAGSALYWLPEPPYPVRPTTLGNVLFAGEVRAGARYGYRTELVLPRLMQLLSDRMRAQLTETRNQLDMVARLSSLGLVAALITTAMLLPYDVWLLIPVGCYLFAWMSYRSAIAAARRFSNALGVAFDLHHLALWDAMSLDRPRNLQAEYSSRAELLSKLFLHEDELEPAERRSFAFRRPPPPTAPDR